MLDNACLYTVSLNNLRIFFFNADVAMVFFNDY